ncbi:MAG: hypothetical protein CMN76_15935 [Spirochaetaceae bacterium]|nr:hypothetical protein [Spirochaetaceae bacterium]|tara:strand:- start:1038 stop:2174 length:1137 start_codon:yes stop_codon:yes gene_type:complete
MGFSEKKTAVIHSRWMIPLWTALIVSAEPRCKPEPPCLAGDPTCDDVSLFVLLQASLAGFELPHSQLSQCFDNAASATCPVGGWPRQDAEYLRARSYQIQNEGNIVQDLQTHILWRRCVLGMTWDGSTCTGAAQALNHADAVNGCAALPESTYGPWRLPEYRELSTLFRYDGSAPALDTSYFPNFPGATGLWSNTTVLATPTNALANNIANGALLSYTKTNTRYVLCVTGDILPLASFNQVAPGIVSSSDLNQYWTSCPLGSSGILDTSSNCAGPQANANWQTALQYCSSLNGTQGRSGWRLPSVMEMLTIMDYSSSSGSMFNDSYFPNGVNQVWTSTTAVYSAPSDGFSVRSSATPFDLQPTAKTTTFPVYCVADPE